MFKEVKVRLAAMFTVIVAGFQILFSFVFLLHQTMYYGLSTERMLEFSIVLIIEILIISLLTFVVGYFFVCETIRPAEDMFERLDQFTIDASHELKTPLGIANSSLDLALKTRKYREYILEAKMYIKRAGNLVEKMLELARMDTFQMALTYVPVCDTIERVLQLYSQEIKKKNLQIVKSVLGESKLKADMVLLERAISNLIENAIKFNVQDGRIEIELGKRYLKVSNTGQTVRQEELENLFDRFYQSDISRSAKGYGIGLAIVKKICDLHGWRVKAESGNGLTSFTITFETHPWPISR
ncbi:MAG: HAMP domain-containing histidine kinase [Patescibacteria group bacterium]|nr:HAMP domain-containing histidine kinase [Patescibacteria group bacterium]